MLPDEVTVGRFYSVSISISEVTYYANQQEKRTNTLVEMTGPIVPLTPVNQGAPA